MADSFLNSEGLRHLWTKVTGAMNTKVDKIEGKGLSTNDLTDALKTKLEGAASASDLTTGLNNKVSKVEGKDLSTNDFTDALKSKVEASLTEVSWDTIKSKPDVALKSDISSVYRYKGSVPTYSALPTSDLMVGDVYNVEDTEMNYAWTGTVWDQLGSSQIEIQAITNAEIDAIVAS